MYKLENAVAISEYIQAIHYESVACGIYMDEKIDMYLKLAFYKIAELIKDIDIGAVGKYSALLKTIRNDIF